MVVIGIDEVGRGALAGPMLVGVGIITSDHYLFDILTEVNQSDFAFYLDVLSKTILRDSKKLSHRQRQAAVDLLTSQLEFITMMIPPGSIDKWGLSRTFDMALIRILDRVKSRFGRPIKVLVDGRRRPVINRSHVQIQPIIDGDNKVGLVAAAAVVAKVKRDNLMKKLAKEYPMYGWQSNVGYGTKAHIQAIYQHGPTKWHRISFLTKVLS